MPEPKSIIHVVAASFGASRELGVGTAIVVGRDPQADLVVPCTTVSRHHVRLTATEEGLHLRDLGSANGTHVRELRVIEAILTREEPIEIGAVVLTWERRRPAPPQDATRIMRRADVATAVASRIEALLHQAAALRATPHFAPLRDMAAAIARDPDADRQAVRLEILARAVRDRLHASAHGARYVAPEGDTARWQTLDAEQLASTVTYPTGVGRRTPTPRRVGGVTGTPKR